MLTGTQLSAIGHGALIVLAVFGLPWFRPAERDPIRITDVSFISEAEFEAAQAASPAEVLRREDAPAELPAPRPAAQPEPQPTAEASDEPAPEVAVLELPAEIEAPEVPDRIVPKVVTVAPPTAAAPPRPRPVPRVESEPTPAVEAVRPAELPKPPTAPEPEVARFAEEPAASPGEAKETQPATLALQMSASPRPRPEARPRDAGAESVMAALKREVAKEVAQRKVEPQATPATEPTPATAAPTVTEPTATEATSLTVGLPLSNTEKDGLKLAVQRCWKVAAGVRDAQELKVTLAAELAADGAVINASIRMIEPHSAPDGRFQQAFEAGRRALIRCSPYDLPREKFGQWRNIEVVFNSKGVVSW